METLLCENLVRQLEEGRGPNLLPETLGNDSAVSRNTNIYSQDQDLWAMRHVMWVLGLMVWFEVIQARKHLQKNLGGN